MYVCMNDPGNECMCVKMIQGMSERVYIIQGMCMNDPGNECMCV